MGSLSQFIKNGANLPLIAGSAAINTGDLLEIGGPGNEAWTVATSDYAATSSVSAILGQTSLVAAATAGGSRNQLARDRLGNIFHAGTNSSGNLVIYKQGPTGSGPTSAILDATATSVNTPKLFQIQNGTFACVYARAAGALYFVIFDAALNLLAGPTSIATEYAATNVVYHDAFALSGGGFAVFYQISAGTSINLATYSNTGSVVLATTPVQTLASSAAQEFIRGGQLSSGNLVVAYRGAMTAGGTAGTSFNTVTVAGAAVAGPTNIDSTAVLGFLELSILTGFFALAEANGTTLRASIYNNAAVIQGSQYSIADTLNSTTYPQVKLTNDGVQFWLAHQTSANNGVNVVQLPTAGATTGIAITSLGSATITAKTYALDAEIINGQLIVLLASSALLGQYWMSVGLPDASLGITQQYLRTAPTVFGTVAGTTGSNWPRVMSGGGGLYVGTSPPSGQPVNPVTNGDFTAIFCYDQQTTAATFLGVQKFEASAIIGLSNSNAIAINNAGIAISSVNPGPGDYAINAIAGTNGKAFNHSTNVLVGILGTLYNTGLQSGSPGGSSTSPYIAGFVTPVSNNGFQPSGIFGTGKVAFFAGSGTFTVPAGITSVRARVWGGGGGTTGTGGTSSFGSFCSATGGAASGTGTGGTGTGGNIVNNTGGAGGGSSATYFSGGGGVANYFGNGGAGGGPSGGSGVSGTSGGGAAQVSTTTGYPGGGGLFGVPGAGSSSSTVSAVPPSLPPGGILTLDLIGCGAGASSGVLGGGSPTAAINGGGGAGSNGNPSSGSFPGGGAGYSSATQIASGGGGFTMGVYNVTPGQAITVTVGAGGTSTTATGGPGLVIVEY